MKNQWKIMIALGLVAGGAQADVFGSGANQFTLDFVNIGNAGNAADGSGYGAVDHEFRIGQKEVTIDQFTKAQAASGNTIGDGDENYWNAGTRTVGLGVPASYVSWNEAARFANWLTSGSATRGSTPLTEAAISAGLTAPTATAAASPMYCPPKTSGTRPPTTSRSTTAPTRSMPPVATMPPA